MDIQAKLHAEKGAGYVRWASDLNTKQMARTMNYLTKHGLVELTAFLAKTSEVTTRFNGLLEKVGAEKVSDYAKC